MSNDINIKQSQAFTLKKSNNSFKVRECMYKL